jgi:hypothetical protein
MGFSKTDSRAAQKFLNFSASFSNFFGKHIGAIQCNNGPKGIKSSANEPIGNNEGHRDLYLVDISQINAPNGFHLYRKGNSNDDISSEKRFETSKTNRGFIFTCK